MKSFVPLALLLVLTPAVAFAAGPADSSGVEPGSTESCGEVASEQVAGATGDQALFASVETLVSSGPIFCEPYPKYIDCDRWTDSYCTYEWNGCRGCCEATYIAPGAYCPDICQ